MLPKMSEYVKTCKDKDGDEKKDNKLMSLDIDDQPWESAAAFGSAVVNAVLCWFYDGKKKNAVVKVLTCAVFLFRFYSVVDNS